MGGERIQEQGPQRKFTVFQGELRPEDDLAREALASPGALEELCDIFITRIYNYALRRVGSVADAEDITSTVFEKVIRSLDSFDPDRASFSTWIYRIALNCVTDHYRTRGRRRETTLDEGLEGLRDAGCPMERLDLFMALAAAIRSLPEKYQEALTLRYFGEMSVLEVAETLGISETAASKRILRGLEALRKKTPGSLAEEMP